MTLKILYTLLVGIFVAAFVGVGILAFYPEIEYPEPPASMKFGFPEINEIEKDEAVLEEAKKEMERYNKEQENFEIESEAYNRNVSILAIIFSIVIVTLSLTLFKKIYLIADGFLLGGVFTLLYGVIRGSGASDNMFRFLVVSIGMVVSLFLGYVKFVAPLNKEKKLG